MSGVQGSTVYEVIAQSREVGDAIRPGGMALTQRALSLCALARGDRVLDVGCGSGATVEYLVHEGGLRAAGIDPSPSMLALGQGRSPALPLVRARGENLPFGDGTMDAVLAECALSLAADAGKVLDECRRVLKTDGELIVSDVYWREGGEPPMLQMPSSSCCLAGAVSEMEWKARLRAYGFHLKLWEDHSQALKEFAARLILSRGSLHELWSGFFACGGAAQDGGVVAPSLARFRPGYFLGMAAKRS